MYTTKKSQPEGWMPHRAVRRLLLPGLFGIAFLVLSSPSTLAQQPGIGIFTEGETYATIYVPGKPGEVPSAPTIQAAVDMAKGPTFISVSLSTSPGFAAEGKEIAVGFANTTVTSSITFSACPRAILIGYPAFQATALIAFVAKTQNILVQFGDVDRVLIEDSSYGHVYKNTINGGLFVRRSAGLYISNNLFTHAAPSLVVRDCNDMPPTSPPPLEWARYLNVDYPNEVGGCQFTKIGPTITVTAAALIINSRLSLQRCIFEEIDQRGVEENDCANVSLQYNTFYKVKDCGIAIFNSEGVVQDNKIRDVTRIRSEGSDNSIGILVETLGRSGTNPSRRCRPKLVGNEIAEVETGISVINATADISGKSVSNAQTGILLTEGCDGAIVGGLFRNIAPLYGIAVFNAAPGLLIENTTMDSVNNGMLIYGSEQVTVKNVEWRAQCEACDRAENIRQPLLLVGIRIVASKVTLDYVRIHSQLREFALIVDSDSRKGPSTVQCSLSEFNVQGPGTGVVVDSSTLTGSFSSWCDSRSLIAKYKANVALSGGALASNQSTALTVESESSFELTQGTLEQRGPAYVTADQISAALDVAKVSGGSKIRLSGTGVSGLGALMHLTDGGQGVFENCDLSGSRFTDRDVVTGPIDGLLVEDLGSMAEVRNGNIHHQGQNGLRTLSWGRVVANGLKINLAKTYVQVDANGHVELDNCTLGETPSGLTGIRVNSGGEAVISNSSIGYFFDFGIKVASGGKCELTNCSLHNGNIGIQAEPGATLSQSGTQFRELTIMPEPSASGGTQ